MSDSDARAYVTASPMLLEDYVSRFAMGQEVRKEEEVLAPPTWCISHPDDISGEQY